MTVKTHENKYGQRWFVCGSVKIVLYNQYNRDQISIGFSDGTDSTASLASRTGMDEKFTVRKSDIDDLDEVLAYVQCIRKEGTPPLVENERWREAVADMVRAGRDLAAITTIGDNSPDIEEIKKGVERWMTPDTAKSQYYAALDAFVDALEHDQHAMTGLLHVHDTQVTWMAVHKLRSRLRELRELQAIDNDKPKPRVRRLGNRDRYTRGDRVRVHHDHERDHTYQRGAPIIARSAHDGQVGAIQQEHRGHGLCYTVLFNQGTAATYDVEELEPIGNDEAP